MPACSCSGSREARRALRHHAELHGQVAPAVPGEDVIASMRVIDASYESLEKQAVISY